MLVRRALLTLAFVAALASSPAHAEDAGTTDATVLVDAGAGSNEIPPPPTAGSSASSLPTITPPAKSSVDPDDPESLVKAAYRGITTKNWFLLAGAMLSIITLVVLYALKKKWSVFGKSKVRWAVTGALAGVGALSHAWLADAPVASSMTLMGAVKVFAAAVFVYVSTKKLLGEDDASSDASRAAA